MRKVLASLKPYYYYLVGEGIKKIEVRKGMPKASDWDNEVLFYMSKDEKSFAKIPKEFQGKYRKHFGKVGMQFICDKVERLEEHIEQGGLYYTLVEGFNEQAQLDNWELHDYGKGKTLYGWHISELKIYDKPKELSEFNAVCRYINEDKSCHFRKVMCPYQQFDYNEDGSINIVECSRVIIRPPQSWQYIEDLGEEE